MEEDKLFDLCGYSAGILFASSLIPQVYKSTVTKDLTSISYGWQIIHIMALIMGIIYSIHKSLPPIYIFSFFELVCMIYLLILKITYSKSGGTP